MDYESLAKQYGGTSEPTGEPSDLDALASQFGGTPAPMQPLGIRTPQESNLVGSLLNAPLRIGQIAGAKIARGLGASEESIRRGLEKPQEFNTLPFTDFGKAKFSGISPEATDEDQIVRGAYLEAGSTLFPFGKVAQGVTTGLRAFGLRRGVSAFGKVTSGAAGGTALDTGLAMQQGEEGVSFGLGTAIGGGIPALGSVRRALGETAPAVINSLIKPLGKNFSYGKNPGRAVSELGITANSLEELGPRISQTRNDVGARLQTVGFQVQGQVQLPQSRLLQPFDDAIKKAVNSNNQALLNRLNEAKNAITSIFSVRNGQIVPVGTRIIENLSFDEAFQLKKQLGDLTKWTGQKTDDETVNGALTRVYGTLKDAMNKTARKSDPELAKAIRKLNEQYADLTSAEIATKYRDVLEKRQNLVNLPGQIGLVSSLIGGVATGGALLPILGAISSIALDKLLSSTAFKTRLASFLANAPKDDLTRLLEANPSIIATLKENFKFPGDAIFDEVSKKKGKLGLSIEDVSKKASNLETEALNYKTAEEFVAAQTNAYHGSYTEVKKFEDGYFGDTTANNEAKVFYFTKSEPHAIEYSREAFARRFEGEYDKKYYKKLGGDKMMEKLYKDAGMNIKTNPSFVDIKNPKIMDWKGQTLAKRWQESYDFINEAKAEGYDGVIFKNISDDVNKASEPAQDVVIAFRPDQIKTKSQLTDIWNKARGEVAPIDEFIKLKPGEKISDPTGIIPMGDKAQFTRKSFKHFIESRTAEGLEKSEIEYLVSKAPEVVSSPELKTLNVNQKDYPGSDLLGRYYEDSNKAVMVVLDKNKEIRDIISLHFRNKKDFESLMQLYGKK